MPFHTWLPDAGAEAPVGGAALLVGVLDKVGTFGFIRYCLPLFPDASRYFAPMVLVLSVVGILYAALLAMGQKDMKRLVAYTSVAHFGFIGLGIFAFTTQGAVRRDVLHGQPRPLHRRAVPGGRHADRPRRQPDAGRLRRRCRSWRRSSPAVPGHRRCRRWRCRGCRRSSASSWCCWAPSPGTRRTRSSRTVGIILAALYILLVIQRVVHGPPRGRVSGPAGCATWSAARSGPWRRCWR